MKLLETKQRTGELFLKRHSEKESKERRVLIAKKRTSKGTAFKVSPQIL